MNQLMRDLENKYNNNSINGITLVMFGVSSCAAKQPKYKMCIKLFL